MAAIIFFSRIPASRAAETLIILSEPLSGPHREAFEGLLAERPRRFDVAPAGRALPPGPHGVVVAFGARAAVLARRTAAPTVVVLAPGYRVGGRGVSEVRIEMTPSPERFVRLLAAAGVRRLLAVRSAPAEPDFVRRAAAAGEKNGVAIDEQVLPEPDGLPHLLRRDGVSADGVWLAPDPGSVTPETFGAAREFSRARAVPFFAPAAGLVMGEVRGELTVSFRDCGREAARAARELLAGRSVAEVVYPASSSGEATVRPSSAAASER